jgi:hypothetical protein
MKLVMLHRQAPVAPGVSQCRLCDTGIEGTLQDHLFVGQPGTAQLTAALCSRCGETLSRLAQLVGPDFSLLVQQEHRPPLQIVGPAEHMPVTRATTDRSEPDAGDDPETERTRQQLTTEANKLAATERTLRDVADHLGSPRTDQSAPGRRA